ncbi:MAG: phage holin family protein [Bacteroidota bacterium]|nr:phage holin family protein [Bacteroidota bacterium]
MEQITRYFIVMITTLVGYLYPSIAYILVSFLFIIIDNISGYFCNQRVKKKFPEKVKEAKYSSFKAWRSIRTLGLAMSIILVCFVLETHIIKHFSEIKITAMVSCLICGVTALSILENWATANERAPKWLNVLRKFLVDKTERYFDSDINGDGKIGEKEK